MGRAIKERGSERMPIVTCAPGWRPLLYRQMIEQVQQREEPLEIDKLKGGAFLLAVLNGIGMTLGLSLLWALEAVRNSFFRALDRMNVRPRPGRASAFPPGRPRN